MTSVCRSVTRPVRGQGEMRAFLILCEWLHNVFILLKVLLDLLVFSSVPGFTNTNSFL